MIILFVNIKLLIIDGISRSIGMILVLSVHVKVAQSVEYVASYGKLFYLWASRVRVPLCTFYSFVSFLILLHYLL